MPRPAPLPSDVESLQRLVREQQAQLLSRDVLIEQLKLQLARLKKMKFGRSSEQLDAQIAQLEFRRVSPCPFAYAQQSGLLEVRPRGAPVIDFASLRACGTQFED